MRNRFFLPLSGLLACLLSAGGCGMMGANQVVAPSVQPAAAASAAIQAYDTNGDGRLDETELIKCPSLRSVLARWDADGDKALSEDEIVDRLSHMFTAGAGLLNISCRITRAGKPVPNCEVRFVPEEFLGGGIKPASGKTEADGAATIAIPPADRPADQQDLPLMQVGLYRVELEGPGVTGQVKSLGYVVDPTDSAGTSPAFDLVRDGQSKGRPAGQAE